jgi:hypothetical protein
VRPLIRTSITNKHDFGLINVLFSLIVLPEDHSSLLCRDTADPWNTLSSLCTTIFCELV